MLYAVLKRKAIIPTLDLYINTIAMQKAVTIQSHSVKKIYIPNIKVYTKSKGPPKRYNTQMH